MQLRVLSRAALSARTVGVVHSGEAVGLSITQDPVQQAERVVLDQLIRAHAA